MMKKLTQLLLCLSLIFIGGCSKKNDCEKGLKINLSQAKLIESDDDHGGFHGDGGTYYHYELKEGMIDDSILEKKGWHELPLSDSIDELSELLIGYTNEHLTEEEIDWQANQGYYYFYDRHSEAEDPYDDTEVNNRASYNCTLAIYDITTHYLYYFELDT